MDSLLAIMAEQQDFSYVRMGSRLSVVLSLLLDLRHLRRQVADLIAIELGDRGDAMDVAQQVVTGAQERLERRLTVAAPQHVATRASRLRAAGPIRSGSLRVR